MDDPRLEPYRNIRSRDPTKEGTRFIAEGRLLVERLLRSRHRCHSILMKTGYDEELVRLATSQPSPPQILVVEQTLLKQLVGYDFHRGVMACGEHPPLKRLDELPAAATGDSPLLVVCGVDNPENIGGLMRSAAAFGVSKMVLSDDVAHPFSRRALRVSMATAFQLDFYRLAQPAAEVTQLAERHGYRTLATTLADAAIPLHQFVRDQRPLAVLVGSEANGLPAAVLASCTDLLTIPMSPAVNSLNANVATAIFLYELTKLGG
ncbi:TrmH family RNA methyltransferase [Planctomycetaceae bacterium SH139]